MILRYGKDKSFLPKDFHLDAGFGHGESHQRQVHFAVEHLPNESALEVLPDVDLQVWMPFPAPGDQRGNEIRSEGGNGSDRYPALEARAVPELLGRILY